MCFIQRLGSHGKKICFPEELALSMHRREHKRYRQIVHFKLLLIKIRTLFSCKRLIKGKSFSSIGKSCPVLQRPIHGSIPSLSCGSSFGSQASLSCDTGYQIAGSSLRSCRADGTWSGNVTTCHSK